MYMSSRLIAIAFFVAIDKKYVEVSPDDVIWANLNILPYERKVRLAALGFKNSCTLFNAAHRFALRSAML